MTYDPLVSPNWLAENLAQAVVLDATYFLPPDPERSRAEYLEAHIPGAQLFEIDEIASTTNGLPHMLPDAETFAGGMAHLGIDGSTPVVVYDRSANHFSAPRVWMTLRLYGISQVYVLNGGLQAWTEAGHAVANGEEEPRSVAPRNWTLDAASVIDGQSLRDEIERKGPVILDARSQDRFDGRAPEPRAGLQSGHMRGATCVPFTSLTQPGGSFATPAQLHDIFGDVPETTPIVSCGSGMTACVLALGLARIDRPAQLYDGSWSEWGQGHLGEILQA